jgi:hypothetical protein
VMADFFGHAAQAEDFVQSRRTLLRRVREAHRKKAQTSDAATKCRIKATKDATNCTEHRI